MESTIDFDIGSERLIESWIGCRNVSWFRELGLSWNEILLFRKPLDKKVNKIQFGWDHWLFHKKAV